MAKIITEKKYLFDIPEGKKKERIDLYLTNCIENATRSRIQKLINSQFVSVNGKFVKSNYNISPFDKIEVTIPPRASVCSEPFPGNHFPSCHENRL